MTVLRDSTIAILGLGLMGGSMALALQQLPGEVKRVIGMDRDPRTLTAAVASRALAQAEPEPGEWLGEADLVVLAAPVRSIISALAQLGRWVRPGALVLDLGSTKSEIVRAMAQLPPTIFGVGGHPMCGKETSGWSAADPRLYRGKLFFLTPTDRSTREALDKASELVRLIGARPVRIDAERHDRLVAAVSHVPYLVAANLVLSVDRWACDEPDLWSAASSGFADTTRLAASSVDMMIDILLTNRQAVVERLRALSAEQNELIDLLAAGNESDLRRRLEVAAERRREWRGAAANG